MRYVPQKLGDQWGIRCENTDEMVRGWRRGQSKLIWRGDFEAAKALSELLSQKPPREDLSKSQRIMYMNNARKRRQVTPRVSVPKFNRCETCGTMYKEAHAC